MLLLVVYVNMLIVLMMMLVSDGCAVICGLGGVIGGAVVCVRDVCIVVVNVCVGIDVIVVAVL